jgi:hypothetical protein
MQQVLMLREKNESLEKQVSSLFFVPSAFLLEPDNSITLSFSNYHRLHIFSQSLCVLYVSMQQAKLLEEIKEHKVLAQKVGLPLLMYLN